MGSSLTKSPLERRNTVLRRSQRKSIHSVKPKVENVYKNIKKFRGTTPNDQAYISIKNDIEFIKNDLAKKGRDLQPQVRTVYENVYKRICEAEDALDKKLEENIEKHEKEQQKAAAKKDANAQNQNNNNAESVVSHDQSDAGESHRESHQDHSIEYLDDDDHAQKEARELGESKEKRKTVELKFVEVIPDNIEPKPIKPVKSPEEKRKSILKMGVPVMPGAMMKEITRESSRISKQYDQQYHQHKPEENSNALESFQEENVMQKINNIIEHLQSLEYNISEFIGKKHGLQYNKIRDELNQYLIELNAILPTDDDIIEQLKISKNYVGSCLNFLDERATEDRKMTSGHGSIATSDDEVFEKNNGLTEQDISTQLKKLSKNTFV